MFWILTRCLLTRTKLIFDFQIKGGTIAWEHDVCRIEAVSTSDGVGVTSWCSARNGGGECIAFMVMYGIIVTF